MKRANLLHFPYRRANIGPLARAMVFAGTTSLLAACGSTVSTVGKVGGDSDVSVSAPVGKVDAQPLGGTTAGAGTIGTGPVKVALILPLTTANGQPSAVGQSMRNAADLALAEGGGNDLTLIVKDDRSSPDEARAVTQAAVGDGAELFIGPLLASDVREASRVTRAAGKPMIAFSTDSSTASHGSYLLSFLIESYVDRILDYAAAKGKKSIAALIPDSDYGRVADAEFQQQAAKRGFRVLTIEHYATPTLGAAVRKIAALGDQIDSLFIPEQIEAMPAMAEALVASGLDGKRVQILGTGIWNDTRVLSLQGMQGAWFSAPESSGFNDFAQRYRAKYNSDPTRIASLAYDAVTLAAALARRQGSQRFTESVLLNRSGFIGTDGVFRFRADGLNDRGLAVLQINNGAATSISPAPRSFPTASAT